jgi:hypothetical protein
MTAMTTMTTLAPMTPITAIAGLGLAGSRHAAAQSPRQVLIVGDDAYRRFDLPDGVLGENLRVPGSIADWQAGERVQVGDEVLLWLTFACEPCGRLDRHRSGLSRLIGRHRGMLARVLRGGVMSGADPVLRIGMATPLRPALFDDDWRARVCGVARAVPEGRWIGYAQLATMAGVARTYCRAFPRLLAGLPPEVAARIRSAAQALPDAPWDGAGLFDIDPTPQRPGVEKR